jgi:hypothetical protein
VMFDEFLMVALQQSQGPLLTYTAIIMNIYLKSTNYFSLHYLF